METTLPPHVEKLLSEAQSRYSELEALVSTPEAASDTQSFLARSREMGVLLKKVSKFRDYQRVVAELRESQDLSQASREDPELREMACEEVERLSGEAAKLVSELTDMVLVEDEDADRNVIVEIRAGTGGDEAALFAADLYRMYSRYAEQRRWKVEVLGASVTDLGGFKEITFSISGDAVYGAMRYEMGGHRVQRVPQTETSGRIHTSAATVAVLGEPEEVEVEVKDSDVRIDYYRASGPGGQHVNTTASAVRITHLQTGLVVAIQEESSQHKNRARAMRVLRSRLYDVYERERKEKEQSIRRGQIGSGDRNQRIRTYNYPQNRVTDHRIGKNFNLEKIVNEGALDPVLEAIRSYERELKLKEGAAS